MRRSWLSIGLDVAGIWPLATLAVIACATETAMSAELHIFTSGAPSEAQKHIADRFSQATGHRIVFTVGTLAAIQGKLSAGEKADIVVLPVPAIETLNRTGALRPESRVDFARVGIGVAVREGSPIPDVSTVDAVRKMLIEARSIVHPDPQGGGLASVQIVRMMTQMGIADLVKPKVTLMFAIGGGVARVAAGEAEIGLFNISEILPVKGVRLAGPLPAQVQSYIVFSGAILAGSPAPDVALAYLRSLSDPHAHDTWTKAGFEPLSSSR